MNAKLEESWGLFGRVARALDAALQKRDAYTQSHCGRVIKLSLALGDRCGLSPAELRVLGHGARFHDIGKIGIPDRVLLKPGRLDSAEYELIKAHPLIGAAILSQVDDPEAVHCARSVRHHHERYDGSGYPDGLCGAEIPLGARIIAIADAFDAMTSRRVYRDSLPVDVALSHMQSAAGSHFDPDLARSFIALVG